MTNKRTEKNKKGEQKSETQKSGGRKKKCFKAKIERKELSIEKMNMSSDVDKGAFDSSH